MKRETFSERRRQVMAMGAGALAAPMVAMAASEPVMQDSGGKMVVSGRVVAKGDGRAIAGAHIEIWQADARGVRAEDSRETVTADGDGRYFVALKSNPQRLYYRVSHRGYTTKVTQLNASIPHQRMASIMRDEGGVTRAAFEMRLAPRSALAADRAELIAL